MRNLTVKRTKSFVGCLMKMKLYIEDPASTEITINDIPCRKLGDLKNGEEKTFSIDNGSLKVFVITDKASKDYSNDFYQLPEGQQDISLSGRNHFALTAGNPFRFDNNDTEEVKANRKNGARRGLAILLAAAAAAAGGAFSRSWDLPTEDNSPIIFEVEGMQITLGEDFYESDADGYTLICESHYMIVTAMKEAFADYEELEKFTLEEYGQLLLDGNGFDSETMQDADGIPYFEYDYTNPDTNETLHFTLFTYRTDDAFWCVQFATMKSAAKKYVNEIREAAKSVQFIQ